ncbi:MAG: lysophospholipid acyltransferase family protein [Elusimicrobiota bacterium]
MTPGSVAEAAVPLSSRLLSLLIYLYMRLVYATVRLVTPPPPTEFRQSVLVHWHHQLAYCICAHRGRRVAALVSRSSDGEFINGALRLLGYETVRGSSSKGAARALILLLRKAEEGFSLAMTPDGPKGPARKAQPGALYLAQKTGLPILPISCSTAWRIVFNSWDRFNFPLPFSRAAIVYGEPLRVGPADDLEAAARELESRLDGACAEAERSLGRAV